MRDGFSIDSTPKAPAVRMGRFAKTVCTRQDAIDRIERLVTELPGEAKVRVAVATGQVFNGTVVERPAVQLFEDADGVEGFNGVLRLDDPTAPPWSVDLWLSDIRTVERIG